MKYKKYTPYLCILFLVIGMVAIIMSKGYEFGSTTDWVNQHIVIPEYFRNRIYANKTLFLDYAPHLGAGTNIYAFSYYGLFRLDVLIGLLLPFVSMKDIVMYGMILNLILGGCFLYYFLTKINIRNNIALFCSILLILSSYFFHAHRQIMFVNYMPFLILAMMGCERALKGKSIALLSISIFLMITHSYYFSVAGILMLLIYYIHRMCYLEITNKKQNLLKMIIAITLAIGMAAILLLPTAYYMLSTSKDVASTNLSQIFTINLELNSLMYSSYGCGFTGIVLVLLMIAIKNEKYRNYSIFILVCLMSSFVCYLLNGTLYVRNKIYLIMNPFILYVIANILNDIWNKKEKPTWIMLGALVVYICIPDKNIWLLLDIPVAILLVILLFKYKKNILLLLALITPIIITYTINKTEEYPKMNKENISEEMVRMHTKERARYMNFINILENVNEVVTPLYNTSMYSSLSNKEYSHFFYDVMNNPICIQNRVALLNNSNILFQVFMGISYIKTRESKVPIGYETIYKKNNTIIVENKDVLPIIYTTNNLLDIRNFNQLNDAEKMEALLTMGIVEKGKDTFHSMIKQEEIPKIIKKYENINIKNNKLEKLEIPLNKDYKGQILMIDFEVKSNDEKEVVVQINDISNKLSRKSAAYPNHNHHFTYVLSQNDSLTSLNIELGKGEYTISNVKMQSIPYKQIQKRNKEVNEVKRVTQTDTTFKGRVDVQEDSYLITSIPYEKGFTLYIDKKKQKIEKVNTAFIGCPIEKGKHTIEIIFEAPYKKIGILVSIVSILCLIGVIYYEKRKLERNH